MNLFFSIFINPYPYYYVSNLVYTIYYFYSSIFFSPIQNIVSAKKIKQYFQFSLLFFFYLIYFPLLKQNFLCLKLLQWKEKNLY